MDGLRWLLLVIGLLVIGGVYLYSRRTSRSPKLPKPADTERREPTLNGEDLPAEGDLARGDDVPGAAPGAEDKDLGEPPQEGSDDARGNAGPQKIVALRIIARGGGAFRGDELILNLRGVGMRHGKFGIFHRFEGSDERDAVFSAASLIEPGSFDLANIRDQQIPGISLFAVLPGPVASVDAFDMLMAAARTLAQSLDGELLDESGSTLSIQRERYIREEVVQFQHSNKVA
jgi:cell division protein ZipA